MIDILKRYYHTWETKDSKGLKKLLHPHLFGIRTYTELLYFDVKNVGEDCSYSTIEKVEISNVDIQGNNSQYTLHITDSKGVFEVVAKAVIKDSKIYKIYEEIKKDTMRVQCVCMYDGSMFSGYQKQVQDSSVQQTIEDALKEALHLQTTPSIHASGRTDKGVHALEQVFHTDITTSIPVEKMKDILNNYLPDSIYITSCIEVNQTIHSRYDVVSKEYMYKINKKAYNPIQRNYEWFVEGLDIERLKQELDQVVGTHDFQSFTKYSDKSTIRTIEKIEYKEDENYLYIHITGNGFMRYMVRYIVGASVQITQGKILYSMKELVALKDHTILKEMAPACGLYLYHVTYE